MSLHALSSVKTQRGYKNSFNAFMTAKLRHFPQSFPGGYNKSGRISVFLSNAVDRPYQTGENSTGACSRVSGCGIIGRIPISGERPQGGGATQDGGVGAGNAHAEQCGREHGSVACAGGAERKPHHSCYCAGQAGECAGLPQPGCACGQCGGFLIIY